MQSIPHNVNIRGRSCLKITYIIEINRLKRLTLAKACVNKSAEVGENIIIFNENKFNISGSDGEKTVCQ